MYRVTNGISMLDRMFIFPINCDKNVNFYFEKEGRTVSTKQLLQSSRKISNSYKITASRRWLVRSY